MRIINGGLKVGILTWGFLNGDFKWGFEWEFCKGNL